MDAGRWEELIASMNPAALQVVIGSAMSRELREHVSAEDIWQDTLTHAWRDRAQHRWTNPSAFRAWLFEIARNRIREAARNMSAEKRGGTQRTARFSDLGAKRGSAGSITSTSISADLPLDSQTPSRIVSHKERASITQEALAALPGDLRDIVRMHLLDELPMESIAERLGIGVSAAWHRYRKATDLLTRALRPGDSTTGAV